MYLLYIFVYLIKEPMINNFIKELKYFNNYCKLFYYKN